MKYLCLAIIDLLVLGCAVAYRVYVVVVNYVYERMLFLHADTYFYFCHGTP